MSEENIEMVRSCLVAFNAGEVDKAAAVFHVDAEWIPYLGVLAGTIHRGPEAIVKMWRDINAHLGGFQTEPREFVDCDEKVVVVVESKGTGTGSGAAVGQRWAQLWSIKDGLVRRVEPFPTREAALEAAGLSE
jgi:ketosteroid isomerase-like protein